MKASSCVFCMILLLVGAAQAADSLNVRLVGSCHTPDAAHGVAVSGNYAFVADFDSGLRVISVADPAHPTEVGHSDTPDSAAKVVVSGNYAYVIGVQSGLHVISVADPAHPTEVGSYDTPGSAYGLAVDGNYAYVADIDSGLWVISISDPAHPNEVGHWQPPGMAGCIAPAGHFLYVDDFLYGLRVVSVADPANPQEVGHNDSIGFGAVAVWGNYVYVGNNGPRLSVVPLADSTDPVEVGWCNVFEPAGTIVIDQYMCVTGGERLSVVSLSDPVHPDTVGRYDVANWYAHGLATSGDYIYVTGDSGFFVCQHYAAGVEEAPGAEVRTTNPVPTIARGVLFLDGLGTRSGLADNPVMSRAALLDIDGRKVLDLHVGANDVSALAPGVYFVSGRTAGSVRKVIVTR